MKRLVLAVLLASSAFGFGKEYDKLNICEIDKKTELKNTYKIMCINHNQYLEIENAQGEIVAFEKMSKYDSRYGIYCNCPKKRRDDVEKN